MRITFFVSSLSPGGAERVISLMANYWAARGEAVTLVTLVTLEPSETDFYTVHPSVRRIALGPPVPWQNTLKSVRVNLKKVWKLRRVLRASRSDVVISFIDKMNVLVLLASAGAGVPVVVSERTDPRRHHIGLLARGLRRLTYPFAAAVVVQTPEVARWAHGRVRKSRVRIIPNPVALRDGDGSPDIPLPTGLFVIAVGRLVPLKGYDILVRAFASCAARHPGWSLVIVGEGPERQRLVEDVRARGLEGRVQLPGVSQHVGAALRQAEVFILSSRYEGFPNALLEGMAHGCAVISTDCPSGPRHIIRHDVDGLLVPVDDPLALGAALDRLMSDEGERRRLGRTALEVNERFALERVMGQWEALVGGLVGRHSPEFASAEKRAP